MNRSLRPIDRYVRAPLGFLWFIVLMLLGALPAWPHSQSWGYLPSGTLGTVLLVVLVLVLVGRL